MPITAAAKATDPYAVCPLVHKTNPCRTQPKIQSAMMMPSCSLEVLAPVTTTHRLVKVRATGKISQTRLCVRN
jgi:hypothetical protein